MGPQILIENAVSLRMEGTDHLPHADATTKP